MNQATTREFLEFSRRKLLEESSLRATTGHPFPFYEKLGYIVTGVFPDVDGIGNHDILMAKRLGGP